MRGTGIDFKPRIDILPPPRIPGGRAGATKPQETTSPASLRSEREASMVESSSPRLRRLRVSRCYGRRSEGLGFRRGLVGGSAESMEEEVEALPRCECYFK